VRAGRKVGDHARIDAARREAEHRTPDRERPADAPRPLKTPGVNLNGRRTAVFSAK
jgi:hypothetical protein